VSQGLVFDIQHFAIHDGPGIRTTVFLKGCPLRCLWCHNPESQDVAPEIFFAPEKCISCGFCEEACPDGLHQFPGGAHIYARDRCTGCGTCTAECYARALEVSGQWRTVEEVLEKVLADRDFYRSSGGGMTLSGGEPMLQFGFARDLLRAAREAGLHTCLETSGCSSPQRFREIAPLVDLFLFDIKETDPERHKAYTGVNNQEILNNLFALDEMGAALLLRCPLIPGLNDRADHFAAVAQLANRLRGPVEIQVMPYHPLGTSKSQRLGKANPLEGISRPGEDQVQGWVAAIQEKTEVKVRKG
jgi:pyruvate formate lyase activating enzyme